MYPRTVVLDSDKLKKLLIEKGELVNNGRQKSERVEELEAEMELIDKEIQEAEAKADVSDLKAEAEAITERFNAVLKDMEDTKKRMFARVKEQVPPELYEKYEETKRKKEYMETERNKIALKAQKINDRIIPISRKLMKPLLDGEYEDIETLRLENGEVVGTIFSHFDDFQKRFNEKRPNAV